MGLIIVKRWAFAVALAWLAAGCGGGNTYNWPSDATFQGRWQTNSVIGVEMVNDLNGFNFADLVQDELARLGVFSEVYPTHDLADPRCDFVVRGNFSYYLVGTHNSGYYSSVYLFMFPAAFGLPIQHMDGDLTARFEVFNKGTLAGNYKYDDAFWRENSVYTYGMGPDADYELRLAARLFAQDFLRDFYPAKEAALK